MQEPEMYDALLSELTDKELVETVGRQFRNRSTIAIVLSAGDRIQSSICWPTPWGDLSADPLAEQLKTVAKFIEMRGTQGELRWKVEDDSAHSA